MGPNKNYFRGQKYIFDIVALYKRRPDLKAFLELLLSLTTIGVFAIFAIRPTALTISNLLKEKAEKQNTVKDMDIKIQNLQTAQGLLAQEGINIALLQDAVPKDPNLGPYIRQLEGLIKKDNVTAQNLGSDEVTLAGTPPPQTTLALEQTKAFPPNASKLNIVISVSGDYNGISSFLGDLEFLRRPLSFDNITFTSTQIENTKSLFLTISGGAPYQGEGQ